MRLRHVARWLGVAAAIVVAAAAVAFLLDVRGVRKMELPGSANIEAVRAKLIPQLQARLRAQGLELGKPVFIRIFKEAAELEVWIAGEVGKPYALFKSYPICSYSGDLGPKLKEGDRQSPEGFYRVGISQLNPNSNYHLSFNLGFPNAYDRHHGRTGSFLMVHGNCVSIGCYAMTNAGIEEIYLLVEASLQSGVGIVPVHIFPFRMSPANLERHKGSAWIGFWQGLMAGHDAFEKSRVPPRITVEGGTYVVRL